MTRNLQLDVYNSKSAYRPCTNPTPQPSSEPMYLPLLLYLACDRQRMNVDGSSNPRSVGHLLVSNSVPHGIETHFSVLLDRRLQHISLTKAPDTTTSLAS